MVTIHPSIGGDQLAPALIHGLPYSWPLAILTGSLPELAGRWWIPAVAKWVPFSSGSRGVETPAHDHRTLAELPGNALA